MSDLLTSGLLALAVAATTAFADGTPPFKIKTKRDDERVEVKVEKHRTILSVHSPFGISQATIERTGDDWPKTVVLRLHLKGLERFRVSNGKVRLDTAVLVNEGKTKVRLWEDGKEPGEPAVWRRPRRRPGVAPLPGLAAPLTPSTRPLLADDAPLAARWRWRP